MGNVKRTEAETAVAAASSTAAQVDQRSPTTSRRLATGANDHRRTGSDAYATMSRCGLATQPIAGPSIVKGGIDMAAFPEGEGAAAASADPGARSSACRLLIRSALIVDEDEHGASGLVQSLTRQKVTVWRTAGLARARDIIRSQGPDLVVTELRVGGKSVFEMIEIVAGSENAPRFVVVTAYPSVATAVRAVRAGVAAYLVKPVTVDVIVSAIERDAECGEDCRALTWPSLDRTIWEYINQVLIVEGSTAEAARRLGIDRRSLRRMLAKYPPLT
jgi:two-component system response regulator RegA